MTVSVEFVDISPPVSATAGVSAVAAGNKTNVPSGNAGGAYPIAGVINLIPILYGLLGVLMAVLLLLLLWGVVDHAVPTDRDIAAQIEASLRGQLNPKAVQVTVDRRSRFTTRLETMDVTIRGFDATQLPLAAAPVPAPVIETPPPPDTVTPPATPGPAPAAPPARPKKARTPKPEKQIQIGTLHLRCEDFAIAGVPVQAVDVTLREVRVPLSAVKAGQMVISSVDLATGALTLHEAALTKFLSTKALPLTNPQVRIAPDGLRVTGGLKAFLNTPVEVRGVLAARNGAVLYLDKPALNVLKVPVPGVIVDAALKQIDPLTDLNVDFPMPVPVVISTIEHQEHLLTFNVSLLFPKASRPQ